MKSRPRLSNRLTLACAAIALAVSGIPGVAGAQSSPQERVSGSFDARNAQSAPEKHGAPEQQAAIEALSSRIPGLAVGMNKETGATRSLSRRMGFLTAPSPGKAKSIATGFLEANTALLGLQPEDLSGYEVTDVVPSKTTGSTHVYLRQVHNGLPLYNCQLHVNVNRDGRILSIYNAFMPHVADGGAASSPTLGAVEAVASAAAHLGILGAAVSVIAAGSDAQQTTRLSAPSVSAEEIVARLMLLPLTGEALGLVWNLQIQTLDAAHVWDFNVDATTGAIWTRFDWVSQGQPEYMVYPLPVESPHHTTPLPPADGRVLVTAPSEPTASPLGWHDDGTMVRTLMRGNNVHAYEDGDGDGLPPSVEPDCNASGQPHCSFPIDLTTDPSAYIPAAVANLFYWNNIIHDVQYQYGFDEAAGNFQVDNFGNGGRGNDAVRAEAQDLDPLGYGCNANFLTPPDGALGGNLPPRMQMYTCDIAYPERDGDFDNGVIVHEYGHGISTRLVGGPGNVACLNNAEQPGEGLSDWWAMVYTAEVGDAGTDVRGMGTYLFGEGPDGYGIRPFPYSTDFNVNPFTYSDIGGQVVPHGVGSVWATIAWEVYWELVDFHGFDPNLYDAFGGAGNQRAMLYVNEGLKNTPCSPTFIDTRDGILQAALDNFGGEDVCRMWEAFARRGLGVDAISLAPRFLFGIDGFNVPQECLNEPPDCSAAAADPGELWPPNHDLVDVTIVGVTDPDGDPITITVTDIRQDEPLRRVSQGDICPDAGPVGGSVASVRAERAGSSKVPGDGRVYHVSFAANDGRGGECVATATVCSPHDQSGGACVDQGPLVDSTDAAACRAPKCGLGFELALLLVPLLVLRRQREA
jgi:extracellular elastinolytic metalloproteinase